MKQELLKHKLAYLSLVIFLIVSIFLFMAAWPDHNYQRYLILLISAFYLLWGVVNHTKTNKLTKKIFFEYLGVSVLAGLLLFLITV
ncbi:MAG: hypothetical protein GF381_01435 [Candidatus Pacebacteria bacterium]|nr:hypothetical protein [Candidatus Paceibacterota bacterium]